MKSLGIDDHQIPSFGSQVDAEDELQNIVICCISFAIVLVFMVHILLKNMATPLRYPFVVFIGWCAGKASQSYIIDTYEGGIADIIPESLIHAIVPLTFYFGTLGIDYHTFSRSMGQILGVTFPAFFAHCFLVTVISYPILNSRVHWGWLTVFVFVSILSSVQVENSVHELKHVHGQLRQLQLLFQGEKVVSLVLMSILVPILFKYYNPLNVAPVTGHHVMAYVAWLLFGTIPAILCGLFYRYPTNFAYNDINEQVVMTIAAIMFCYWFTEFLGSSGPFGVLCFGITVGWSKMKYSSETERFFAFFWNLLRFVCRKVTFLLAGFLLGCSPRLKYGSDLGIVIIFYGMCLIARTVSMTLVGLLYVTRSGWIAWKHYVVAIWGVYKSNPNLINACYALIVLRYPSSEQMFAYVVCVIFISTFIHGIALTQLFRALGMFDLSQSRLMNMNAAVVLINHCREKVTMSLKMDRVIADANWLIVDQTTKLMHPYSRLLASADAKNEGHNAQARLLLCTECGAENVAPPTKKELTDITLEAKHRILKAQMMSFWKQSENGTLSSHGYGFLLNVVEMASVRDDPVLSQKDLKLQREGSKTLRTLKAFFGYLYTVTSTTHRFIPTNWLRALCFRICTSRTFQLLMACLSIMDLITLINFLRKYYFEYDQALASGHITEFRIYQIFDFIFFVIFFIEFSIHCLGIGVIQYFQTNINKIEFATGILLRPTQIIMVIDSYYRIKLKNLLLIDRTVIYVKTMLLLRFARIYIFIVALIPKMLNIVDRRMDDDLIKSYDVGKAYLIALDKVMKFLGYIVDNETVFNHLIEYMETERRMVAKELGLIQKDRPTIAITIKTRHAVRHVINTMNDCVADMKEEGMLDNVENQVLRQSLLKVKKRTRSLILISPSSPETILGEIPWLYGDKETEAFLKEHAMMSSYFQNDIIIHYGDEPVGLFILITGVAHCYYRPSEKTTSLAKKYGVTPNYDFFINHHNIDVSQEEFVVGGGNVIGEFGIITGRRYDMTVTCETSVQLYYIPWKILKAVIHDSANGPVLQAKLWKTVAIKIGVNLLPYTSRFQGWSREKLLLYLQRGVVPGLFGVTVININTDLIDDVFIIEGVGMDMATRSTFVGPIMIPRTIQKLLLPDSVLWDFQTDYETRLLIIPSSHVYLEDIMGPEGIFKGNMVDQDPTAVKTEEEEEIDVEEIILNETTKTNEACAHKPKALSPENLLKLRRKRNRFINFMEYIPTLGGPLEGNIALTTFIVNTDSRKGIRSAQHNRDMEYSSISYTQDIEERSEGESKDMMADEVSLGSKRFIKTKSRTGFVDDRRSTSYSKCSGMSERPSDVPKILELMVIESTAENTDNLNSKRSQTKIQLSSELKNFQKAMEP